MCPYNCTRALRECAGRPASRQPRRRDGQVQVQCRLAVLLLHGGDTASTGCRSRELLTDRARAVGVAARVLPQADRQREVAARLLLIRPLVGSSVTWLNRRLIHKQQVRCNNSVPIGSIIPWETFLKIAIWRALDKVVVGHINSQYTAVWGVWQFGSLPPNAYNQRWSF